MGPALVANGLEAFGHQRGHGAQFGMGLIEAAQFNISKYEQQRHTTQHNAALQSVAIHDALEAARQHVSAHDKAQNEQRDIKVLDFEKHMHELGPAQQHGRGIQGHEQEDHQAGQDLQGTALKPFAQQFRGKCEPPGDDQCGGSARPGK